MVNSGRVPRIVTDGVTRGEPIRADGDRWGPLGTVGDRWGPLGTLGTANYSSLVLIGN